MLDQNAADGRFEMGCLNVSKLILIAWFCVLLYVF